jgi:hypothetical protein
MHINGLFFHIHLLFDSTSTLVVKRSIFGVAPVTASGAGLSNEGNPEQPVSSLNTSNQRGNAAGHSSFPIQSPAAER